MANGFTGAEQGNMLAIVFRHWAGKELSDLYLQNNFQKFSNYDRKRIQKNALLAKVVLSNQILLDSLDGNEPGSIYSKTNNSKLQDIVDYLSSQYQAKANKNIPSTGYLDLHQFNYQGIYWY